MNKPQHMAVGFVIGGGVYLLRCRYSGNQPTLGEFLLYAGGGATVACLHDVLEPAWHPNHRQFVHSLTFNAGLAVFLRSLWQNQNIRPEVKNLGMALGLACLSHPALDATTPRGLPLLGKLQ